ncbi:MAG: argininosuccinate lyase [bacterium]|nr:argininosuccinate lyase [bacterium]
MANILRNKRFENDVSNLTLDFVESISFDKRLAGYDISGSLAHVTMLSKCKIIPKNDADKIIKGLKEIGLEIAEGKFRFKTELEDIHFNIESRLKEKIGSVAGKLHTARSRNDQVALDLRLFLREEVKLQIVQIKKMQHILLNIAEKNIDLIMPGYTHLQHAQPVSLAHHFLAYYFMFQRDKERLTETLTRINVMPLGSAALAGTAFPIDRNYTAKLLNFPKIAENSMDAVSDRDFAVEYLFDASLIIMHLSRLSEELILWSSQEFSFIEINDEFTTGSSIMPQKKNPDICELVRGKTGRVYGNLISMLTIMKSLPMTYNRDLQEDKEAVFDSVDTLEKCLEIYIAMLPKIKFNEKNMAQSAALGFLEATEIADYLVREGMPFRDAHSITGKIVRYCLKNNIRFLDLDIGTFRSFSDLFRDDIYEHVTLTQSVDSKKSFGGTSFKNIKETIRKEKGRL